MVRAWQLWSVHVMQYQPSLWWGDMVPPSTVQPQESASVRHDKMHEARAQRGLTLGCASGTGRTLHFVLVAVFIDAYHGGVGVIFGRG